MRDGLTNINTLNSKMQFILKSGHYFVFLPKEILERNRPTSLKPVEIDQNIKHVGYFGKLLV